MAAKAGQVKLTHKIIKRLSARPYRGAILFAIPGAFLLIVFILGIFGEGSQQFSDLAQAFVHGHLNFLKSIGSYGQDPVLYHGKIYWDEGPLPALILMPFVAFFDIFHIFFQQGYIEWAFVIGILYFILRLAGILRYSKEDSAILTLGFALGSVFIGIAPISSSWLFGQVVTTFLLFWGLYEFYSHKRWWLLGVICGLVLMTRITATPLFIFFGLELWQAVRAKKLKLMKFVPLCLPILGAIGLLGLYNFLRFHNPLNGGYEYQLLPAASAEARSYGIFSLKHIPTNFYSAVLRAPEPVLRTMTSWTLKFPYIENNVYGMSIFITSPYFLYFFTQKWSAFDKQARHLLIAIAVSALLMFSYYGIGMQQFGYRYSLDFLPELFLLFMLVYRKNHERLSRGMKFLLLGSGIVNFYLVWSFLAL